MKFAMTLNYPHWQQLSPNFISSRVEIHSKLGFLKINIQVDYYYFLKSHQVINHTSGKTEFKKKKYHFLI